MIGLSHVVLHIALCNRFQTAQPATPVALRLKLIEPDGHFAVDHVYRFRRGRHMTHDVEFDLPQGIYALLAQVQRVPNCVNEQFFLILPNHNRQIKIGLGPPRTRISPTLVGGSTPISFTYVKPTIVLFDASQAKCGKPIPTPLNVRVVDDVEFDAFYAEMYSRRGILNPKSVLMALRVNDVQGGYHYVRVPAAFPPSLYGPPPVNHFDVKDDLIDVLATQPEDTLFCPRIYRTEIGG